jgi:hypothetical protein
MPIGVQTTLVSAISTITRARVIKPSRKPVPTSFQ